MFIAKDGHLVSSAEPQAWIDQAGRLTGKNDEQGLALLQKALAWYQTRVALADGEEGMAVCWTGEGVCLARMGEVHAARDEWKEAARFFRDASRVFHNVATIEAESDLIRSYGGAQNEALALGNLARACGCLKKYRESLGAADAARDLFRALDDRDGELQSLRLGGYACADLNMVDEAGERLESAARLADQIGDRELAAELRAEIERIRS